MCVSPREPAVSSSAAMDSAPARASCPLPRTPEQVTIWNSNNKCCPSTKLGLASRGGKKKAYFF